MIIKTEEGPLQQGVPRHDPVNRTFLSPPSHILNLQQKIENVEGPVIDGHLLKGDKRFPHGAVKHSVVGVLGTAIKKDEKLGLRFLKNRFLNYPPLLAVKSLCLTRYGRNSARSDGV